MRLPTAGALTALLALPALGAAALSGEAPKRPRCVVFAEPGFPTVESEAVAPDVLRSALDGCDVSWVSLDALQKEDALAAADLLVLPHGSAFASAAWPAVYAFIRGGGSVLNIGGRAFSVPVSREGERFRVGAATQAYAREIGIWHSYEAPGSAGRRLVWDDDFAGFPALSVRALRTFALAPGPNAGYYRGLGFLEEADGARVAAPITRLDYIGGRNGFTPLGGARCVFLSFEPEPGFWAGEDGRRLIRFAAEHAARGAVSVWVEVQSPTVGPGELAQVVAHVQRGGRAVLRAGRARLRVELAQGSRVLEAQLVSCEGTETRVPITFKKALAPGLYVVRATYEDERGVVDGHVTGVWSRDASLLASGVGLEVAGETFRRGGTPYLPFGVNYFSTDVFTTGLFVGDNPCGNPYRWERDFAEMERLGLTFVRTGTWLNHLEYLDKVTGGVEERYLSSLEAFLHSAARHHLQVQFTFFAFDPQTTRRSGGERLARGAGAHPYLDPAGWQAQARFVRSIVSRFKDVPFLSWDLINEPNFANPERLWSGNQPHGDGVERAAWQEWLQKRYGSVDRLAEAWNTTPRALGEDFGGIAAPTASALEPRREGSLDQSRVFDWNLFVQDGFTTWTRELIGAVRAAGGRQAVVVGQDEGGVSNRVLNQFYADAGVAFTTNHTWWYDDALLWGSLAGKRPDLPALIGETGMQPAWRVDGTWRHDAPATLALVERKLALGFAAGNLGSLHWWWARDDVFGLLRGDGSRNSWVEPLAGLARFAANAGPHTGRLVKPDVALVLPQSLQLSVLNRYAQEAQHKSVRALYQHARGTAYAVGEYQLALLGEPRLIILPSPWVFSDEAWQLLLDKVRAGAVLAVTGPIDLDPHFRGVSRLAALGLPGGTVRLDTREVALDWDGELVRLSFGGDKTTYLERGATDGGSFLRRRLGRGEILYCPWPLELNDDSAAIARFYRRAMEAAGISAPYATSEADPGILICPTRFEDGTLYVLTSESAETRDVRFRDLASGVDLRARLAPGRAALAFVQRDGGVVARYGEWP